MTIPISYNHSPQELIRARTSTRRFTGTILSGEVREELEHYCRAARMGPFGGACRFRLIDSPVGGDPSERVGAYGLIRGARTYLAGATGPSRYSLEDFGYLFELLLLKATDLGMGSCWLGGTFTRGRFARAMELQGDETIPAVSPIGIPTGQRSMVDQVIRWGAGSKRRKPREQLFYDGDRAAPLSEDQAGPFAAALEMVRLAPSASNRQPWRCLKTGETIHFYLQRFPGYRAVTPTDLQRIDMGIAMSHFDLAMASSGIEGSWQVLDPPPLGSSVLSRPEAWQRCEYLVSWGYGRPGYDRLES